MPCPGGTNGGNSAGTRKVKKNYSLTRQFAIVMLVFVPVVAIELVNGGRILGAAGNSYPILGIALDACTGETADRKTEQRR